jgi:hypothetical protein
MEKEKVVIEYETKQRELKKLVKKVKRKIPYFIFGFIFFGIALITLLDGKLTNFVGNSYNLILVISTILVVISTIYMVIISIKVKNINKEIKSLGEKMYNKMKL